MPYTPPLSLFFGSDIELQTGIVHCVFSTSFNGKPQAIAISRTVACGLPLNKE